MLYISKKRRLNIYLIIKLLIRNEIELESVTLDECQLSMPIPFILICAVGDELI